MSWEQQLKERKELSKKGIKEILELVYDCSIPEVFYCPECKTRKVTELVINQFGFDFRCPNCWFTVGGGTLFKEHFKEKEAKTK